MRIRREFSKIYRRDIREKEMAAKYTRGKEKCRCREVVAIGRMLGRWRIGVI